MDAHSKSCICFILFLFILATSSFGGITFTGTELLGCPTDHSISLNVVADTVIEVKKGAD